MCVLTYLGIRHREICARPPARRSARILRNRGDFMRIHVPSSVLNLAQNFIPHDALLNFVLYT